MTKTEQKVFDYAQSVEWDYDKVDRFIYNLPDDEFDEIECPTYISNKAVYFIGKHEPRVWIDIKELTEEESAYNTQLIKHSKEMLEMLKECYKYLPYEGVMRKKVEQLIKQSTEL